MSLSPDNSEKLHSLINQLQSDGQLPDKEAGDLEELLLGDEEAREIFVLSQDLHTMLEVEKSVRLQLASDLLPDNVVAMPGVEIKPESIIADDSDRIRKQDARHTKEIPNLKIGLRIATSFAAMIAAIFGVLWMYAKVGEFTRVATQSKNQVPSPAIERPEGIVSYVDHVRPILEDNCFGCHGADDENRKADLRLDLASGSIDREDPVIVRGNSKSSELVSRISSDDPEYIMPPPESKKVLSKPDIGVLVEWIDQGADYDGEWSIPGNGDLGRELVIAFLRGW